MKTSFSDSLKMLWHYLRPHWRRVALLAVLLLLGIGLQLYAPQLVRRFLDLALGGAAVRMLTQTAVIYLVITIAQKIVTLLTSWLGEDLGWAATNQLRVDLTRHCMRLDMGFHKLRTPGELIQRIDGDVSRLAEQFSQLIVQVLGNGLLLIGVLILIFQESWQFGIVGIVYAILIVIAQRSIQKPMIRVSGQIRQGYTELFSYLEERISGTEDIRANGGEEYVMQALYPLMTAVNKSRQTSYLLGGVSFTSSYMLYVFALVATLALAGLAYLRNEMTLGTVYLMVFYVGLLETPVKQIRRQIENLQRAIASIRRIDEFFQIQPQVVENVKGRLGETPVSVQFQNVTFTYKDQLSIVNGQLPIADAVLNDVDFELKAGSVLGILGRTGSGKTTLTRLLFRLYDVDEGAIELGGVNVADVKLSDLRQHVGMVTQDVQLFAASIRDNLTLFSNYNPDALPIDDAQIMAAIETLGLESWFKKLPDGLDTMLKSGGQGLSAGEAQLLAFTRVFLRDPRLVILDEASSRLDPTTERLLEQAIDRLLHNRTGIIIAHRLHTVQRADDILILENGRIVEHGHRIQLAANSRSHFSHLLQIGMEDVLS